MADYTKATGYNGTMLIRDTGVYVEFWLKAGSATSNGALPWRYTINGVTSGTLSFDFNSGGTYQRLGIWTITYDQTVTFYIGDSGTSGLGGPTSFSVPIVRDSVPGAPAKPVATILSSTSARVTVADGDNGGLPITARRMSSGLTTAATGSISNHNGTLNFPTLLPGTTYYVKSQNFNAKGWGVWSAVTSFTTWKIPPAPSTPVLSNIGQSTITAKFTGNGSGGPPLLEWQLGYGTDPTAPQTLITSNGVSNLINLQPGAKYYFWARGRNSVGWGKWSGRSQATLRAGARVPVGGVPKNAVPYVKYNGVWRPAVPRVKIAGMWKETG